MTITELKQLKESEDKVEFKEAKRNYPYAGGSHHAQEERRKCFLGYVVAFANEGGGSWRALPFLPDASRRNNAFGLLKIVRARTKEHFWQTAAAA